MITILLILSVVTSFLIIVAHNYLIKKIYEQENKFHNEVVIPLVKELQNRYKE